MQYFNRGQLTSFAKKLGLTRAAITQHFKYGIPYKLVNTYKTLGLSEDIIYKFLKKEKNVYYIPNFGKLTFEIAEALEEKGIKIKKNLLKGNLTVIKTVLKKYGFNMRKKINNVYILEKIPVRIEDFITKK